jgi:hypothetical protein
MSQEKPQGKSRPSHLIFKPQAKANPKAKVPVSEDERLRAAREKALEYREPKPPVEKKEDRPTTVEEWADMVGKRINEAMRRGDFDNLPGHGKPLKMERDPFVPDDQQMANKILKNNDMTPLWIAERKDLLRAVESWREQFRHVVSQAHANWIAAGSDPRRVQIRQSWERWLVRWEDEIKDLNRRIGTFNLKQPITHLEVYKLQLDNELKKVGMTRTLER